MIPILEGAGVSALGTSGSSVAPQSGADTGSGDSFPEILSAEGQSVASGEGGALSSGNPDSGGNPLLPGGKKLPPSPTVPESGGGEGTLVPAVFTLTPDSLLLPGATGVPAAATPVQGTGTLPPTTAGLPAGAPGSLAPLPLAGEAAATPIAAAGDDVAPRGLPVPSGPILPGVRAEGAPVVTAQPAALGLATESAATPAATAAAAATTPDGVTDAARLVQPGPVAAATARDQAAQLEPGSRRLPELTTALSDPVRTQSESPARPLADVKTPPVIDIASASARLNVADDAAAVKLSADPAALTPVAEGARPATVTSALPPALVSPLALATTDASLPLGAKLDVTGVLVAQPGEPAWNSELAGRLSLMLRNGTPEANLQLNPPELGRMEVKIATDGDQARVLFTVQGAETREVIEQALPRLRDMLEESGLSLSRFDVADQSSERQHDDGGAYAGATAGDAGVDETVGALVAQVRTARPDALVDYYA